MFTCDRDSKIRVKEMPSRIAYRSEPEVRRVIHGPEADTHQQLSSPTSAPYVRDEATDVVQHQM